MTMLDTALNCVARGWCVFPCWPKSKKPMTQNGFKDATLDESQIREWWSKAPDANVAIATGPSGLCVVDVDHGITDAVALVSWMTDRGLDPTYWVRTGRRPEFGAQLYYLGSGLKSTGWKDGDISGDIRCSTGYVMAAGSIHPDSGEAYTCTDFIAFQPVPEYVKTLTAKADDPSMVSTVDDETADDWKTWLYGFCAHYAIDLRDYEKRVANGWWIGIVCPWEDEHRSGPGAESSTVLGALDGKLAFECSHGTCKAAKRNTEAFKGYCTEGREPYEAEPGADIAVTLGTGLPMPKKVDDWRSLFHSQKDVLDCPPPSFLIDKFLAKQAICAIAAPVAQRKSLIALNVARSLCTGLPLFGCLPVVNRPSRVLYLCPEMGLISLSARVRSIGLSDYVGNTLFFRSMNLGNIDLSEIPDEALLGSVLIVDTAVRFMKGDENSVKDMQGFSETLFAIQRKQGPNGAIIVLYHSPKATKDASELTLENCMRGSGELGAAVTDAHGTRLQDAEHEYDSPSFIRHIKARDYEGLEPFEVTGDRETGILTRSSSEVRAVLNTQTRGPKANKDGMDDAAREYLQKHKDDTVPQIQTGLKELGIDRGLTWIKMERLKARAKGSTHAEG